MASAPPRPARRPTASAPAAVEGAPRRLGSELRRHGVAIAVAGVAAAALLPVGAASGQADWPVYAVVVAGGMVAVVVLHLRVGLSTPTVWGLVAFAVGHLAGGMIPVGDGTLYGVWLVEGWLRYDNVQHAVGFGVVGRATWEALQARLAPRPSDLGSVAFVVVVLGASAFGALNEIAEWVLTRTVAGAEVGGYDNTARDLVANLVGGVVVGGATARSLAGYARRRTSGGG